jgi:cystathionine beta-synthase
MNNISFLVGNTPITKLEYHNNTIFLKLESFNPGLSIKDRVAFYICHQLSARKGLQGKRVVEYSSGNLAIGLAQASKVWGFNLTLIITSGTSPDKIKLLQRYGIDLIMVDENEHSLSPLGFRGFAQQVAAQDSAIFIDQFNNPLNPEAHQRFTGPEIHKQVPVVDYIFAAMGTGGTATGIARYFRENKPDTKVIGVSPNSGVFFTSFHKLNTKRSPVSSKIEGVGEDFLPANLDLQAISGVVEVEDDSAIEQQAYLLNNAGIFVGGSSGLALAGAMQFVDKYNLIGQSIVVICPDSGNRYLANFVPKSAPSPYSNFVREKRMGNFPCLV